MITALYCIVLYVVLHLLLLLGCFPPQSIDLTSRNAQGGSISSSSSSVAPPPSRSISPQGTRSGASPPPPRLLPPQSIDLTSRNAQEVLHLLLLGCYPPSRSISPQGTRRGAPPGTPRRLASAAKISTRRAERYPFTTALSSPPSSWRSRAASCRARCVALGLAARPPRARGCGCGKG